MKAYRKITIIWFAFLYFHRFCLPFAYCCQRFSSLKICMKERISLERIWTEQQMSACISMYDQNWAFLQLADRSISSISSWFCSVFFPFVFLACILQFAFFPHSSRYRRSVLLNSGRHLISSKHAIIVGRKKNRLIIELNVEVNRSSNGLFRFIRFSMKLPMIFSCSFSSR